MKTTTHPEEQVLCEFNPAERRGAYADDDPGACPNPAVWAVGQNGRWLLCGECVDHPYFVRYVRRRPLNPGEKS